MSDAMILRAWHASKRMVVPVKIEATKLKETKVWEYVVRFFFGGTITAIVGLVANEWGPSIGGLFLAFPAILPASLTLAKQHDGRREASEDARGASLAAVGLVVFAMIVRWSADWAPALVLTLATLAWLATSFVLWALVFRLRR